jgi:hypothetical protein
MKVYLDIDGVLILRGGTLAAGAEPFLRWVSANHKPIWLSTRTRTGVTKAAVSAFECVLPGDLIHPIPAATFTTLKTEALPLTTGGWVWVDDAPLWHERLVLRESHAEHRLLLTRSDRKANALSQLPTIIESLG